MDNYSIVPSPTLGSTLQQLCNGEAVSINIAMTAMIAMTASPPRGYVRGYSLPRWLLGGALRRKFF